MGFKKMRTKFLTSRTIRSTVARFMEEFDEYHWSIAWGSDLDELDLLLKNKRKIRSVSFGLAFSHTDPALVRKLIGVNGAFVVPHFPGGTYHPKLYCFRSGDRAAAVVGSANFTHGGLGRNLEAGLSLLGDANDSTFAKMFDFIERNSTHSKPVTDELADAYAASCNRTRQFPTRPRDPLKDIDARAVQSLTSPLISMSWPDYARAVDKSKHHDVSKSLELLRTVQHWLSSVPSFSDLEEPKRKAIAGIPSKDQRVSGGEMDNEWGWFGSMRGMGDFANRIIQNDENLSSALDRIPRYGEVKREEYEQFCQFFVAAFAKSERVGGVPTASRLLAMKRPDTFLCVCKPNISRASKSMGFARTTLDLENYWERVVEVIRSSEWYNSPRPSGGASRLWDNRAAMLDTIFYEG
ncbi:restriction endonuclease PLD domain-containing protein [Rhizobium ruizarguesonis]|nr:hypothetical protein G7039_08700 [Rhizobium leguminosarum]